jgi:hypothetical protein
MKASDLGRFINGYLSKSAGQLTPAGQAVVSAGLMTQQDLVFLGGTTPVACPASLTGNLANGLPCINTPPAGNIGLGWLKSVDLRLAWAYKIKERVTVQPAVTFYNAFNFANFDAPANLPSGILNGAGGSVSNLTAANRGTRVGPGSGTFSLGAPRELEFALKLTF